MMAGRKILIFLFSLLLSTSAFSQVAQQWVRNVSGFQAIAVVADQTGNAYVTGPSLQDAAHNYKEDIVTVKYDPAGNQIWLRQFDETADATAGSDVPTSMAIDPSGNIIIVGVSYLYPEGNKIIALKYSPSGTLLWRTRSTVTGQPVRVLADTAGNIYLTGYTAVSSADYVTMKLGPGGTIHWTRTYNGPNNFRDETSALDVTATGMVAVTGRSTGGTSGYDFATIVYNTDGTVQWTRRYDHSNGLTDQAADVAFGPNDEVYVGGLTQTASGTDYALIKYDAAGLLLWQRFYNGPPNKNDGIKRLRVDHQGNIIVTGYEQQSSFYSDFATIKYSPNGNLLWIERVNRASSGDEIPSNMVIGSDDSVYITGETNGTIATVKYDAAGTEQWFATFDNPNTLADRGYSLALGSSNKVVVAGQSPIVTVGYTENGNQSPVAAGSANPLSGNAPLFVAFSSSGSFDPDGTISAYAWKFGDGTTSPSPNPTHTYNAAGNYTAVLTVTDNAGATSSKTLGITVSNSTSPKLHVQSQSIVRVRISSNRYRADDSILIVDQNNQPVGGATVVAAYSGPTAGTVSGVTGSNGIAVLGSKAKSAPTGEWCFQVTSVSKDTYVYDAIFNIVTKQCESGPQFRSE